MLKNVLLKEEHFNLANLKTSCRKFTTAVNLCVGIFMLNFRLSYQKSCSSDWLVIWFLQKLQEFLGICTISSSELVLHSKGALTQLELPQVTKIGTALCVYRTHSVSFSWKIAVAVALALAFDMKYELHIAGIPFWSSNGKYFFLFLTDSLEKPLSEIRSWSWTSV